MSAARDSQAAIMLAAWRRGEPGILDDAAIRAIAAIAGIPLPAEAPERRPPGAATA